MAKVCRMNMRRTSTTKRSISRKRRKAVVIYDEFQYIEQYEESLGDTTFCVRGGIYCERKRKTTAYRIAHPPVWDKYNPTQLFNSAKEYWRQIKMSFNCLGLPIKKEKVRPTLYQVYE